MAEVAVCPRCNGDKRIYNARSGQPDSCPTCNGQGVVRVPALDEGAQQTADDARDLTYRP
jgi:DnaJ-class molecular chaperone